MGAGEHTRTLRATTPAELSVALESVADPRGLVLLEAMDRLSVASSAPALIRGPLRRECLGSVRRPPPGAVRTAETGCAEP
jgi:hypothetical protein